jgi:hypothetical protein
MYLCKKYVFWKDPLMSPRQVHQLYHQVKIYNKSYKDCVHKVISMNLGNKPKINWGILRRFIWKQFKCLERSCWEDWLVILNYSPISIW